MTHPGIRAAGVISVVSNVAPAAVEQMAREALAGSPRARELADALGPLFAIVTVKAKSERRLPDGRTVQVEDRFRNPLGIKTLMAGLGMPAGPCRPPLGRMTPEGVAMVRAAARKVWETDRDILKPIEDAYGVDVKERLKGDRYWA
jgi:4-hydroxy-tetrahydrodipicolinate synthase